MKLFRSQRANASEPAPAEVVEPDQTVPVVSRRPSIMRALLTAVIIVLLALVATRIINSQNSEPASPAKNKVTRTAQGDKSKAPNAAKDNKQAGAASPGGAASPAPATSGEASSATSEAAGSTQNGPDDLTNTGPGDVIMAFVATSIAASGLYYTIILRRLNAS